MNINRVILAGRLTCDPDLRTIPNGVQVAKFGIAINSKHTDKQTGQTREAVTFVDCQAWSQSADAAAKYLKKGDPVLVEGKLKLDQWDDKQSGQKRSKLFVVVDRLQFLRATVSTRAEPSQTPPVASASSVSPQPQKAASASGSTEEPAEQIPF